MKLESPSPHRAETGIFDHHFSPLLPKHGRKLRVQQVVVAINLGKNHSVFRAAEARSQRGVSLPAWLPGVGIDFPSEIVAKIIHPPPRCPRKKITLPPQPPSSTAATLLPALLLPHGRAEAERERELAGFLPRAIRKGGGGERGTRKPNLRDSIPRSTAKDGRGDKGGTGVGGR